MSTIFPLLALFIGFIVGRSGISKELWEEILRFPSSTTFYTILLIMTGLLVFYLLIIVIPLFFITAVERRRYTIYDDTIRTSFSENLKRRGSGSAFYIPSFDIR